MINLSQYRPYDWKWYEQYKLQYGEKYFNLYKEKIKKMFYHLKPGRYYNLVDGINKGSKAFYVSFERDGQVVEELNLDLFVKMCVMIMSTCHYYEFTDDYLYLRRIKE